MVTGLFIGDPVVLIWSINVMVISTSERVFNVAP
jgi:hypothetical protein